MEIRRLGPRDAERVQEFVRGLSPRSRLERFFAPVAELAPRQLRRVTAGPGFSLAAFDSGGAILALAEYVSEDGVEAEFGIVIADAWQGRGVGERLVAALAEGAQRSGIARLAGVTHASNRPMRRLAQKLGFSLGRDVDPALVRVEKALCA